MNFDERIQQAIQQQMLRNISDAVFVERYPVRGLKVPQDIIETAFASIDRNRILNMVREQIEEQIAKTIVGQLLTETANDTKRMMRMP